MRLSSLRAASVGAIAAAAICAAPADAAAAKLYPAKSFSLAAQTAGAASCAVDFVRGASIARRTVTAPADGVVSVRLRGAGAGDWDLGLVDKVTKQTLNGSAGPVADELADTRVDRGQRIVVQACRRSGSTRSVRVKVTFIKVDFKELGEGYTTKVVRVSGMTGPAEQEKLAALGLDTTDHPGPSWQDVILHSAADEAKLRASGLQFDTRIADLLRRSRANRLKERRDGRSRSLKQAAALPSGRTSYRTLPEIQDELKALALANPGFVRLFTLPLKSYEGRDIMGIEIAENVLTPPDGRPEYIQVGTHHAREWPANEAAFEFGIDLINAYKSGGDPRMVNLVKGARTYIVPVLNVDGFNASIESEGLNPDGSLSDPVDSGGTSGDAGDASGAYKRKTCSDREAPTPPAPGTCLARTYDATTQTGFVDRGVDPNRNYGVEWGGPGTESDIEGQTYHGPAPWSESETEAMRRWLRDHQPTLLVTNHTYTGLLLRPPGTAAQAPVPDEDRLRAIGDAMATETDYISQFSYQLYDTSGTTDDYIYGALGGFSYTPEIGKVEFHPAFTTGFIPEYTGQPELDADGNPTGRTLGGLREAYVLAGQSVIDAAGAPANGIAAKLDGSAPAGRVLRLRKNAVYRTSALPDDNGVQFPVTEITEPRNSTLTVGATGRFTWTINPSTQPNAAETAWTLTCEDGAGNVLETRQVFAARSQLVNLGLTCGAGSGPGDPQTSCTLPDGFAAVDARRAGRRGLRLAFTRKAGAGLVTVTVSQTSKGRRIIKQKRVARFTGKAASFTWGGRRSLTNGVYVVRFSVKDAAGRTDVRRVTVARKQGRFAKKGTFYLADRCR